MAKTFLTTDGQGWTRILNNEEAKEQRGGEDGRNIQQPKLGLPITFNIQWLMGIMGQMGLMGIPDSFDGGALSTLRSAATEDGPSRRYAYGAKASDGSWGMSVGSMPGVS